MPYKEMKASYLEKEKRSLWEFRLKLTDKEKHLLKNLIKSLEGKTDKYNFFYNNCRSQLEKLLSSVNIAYKCNNIKRIVTPLEYAKYLTQKELIEEIRYIPAKKYAHFPKIYEYPSVTKLSLGVHNTGGFFEFNPIYHDKSQTQYFEHEVDSRILGVSCIIGDNSLLKIKNIDFFKLTSYETITTSIDLGYDDKFRSKFGLGTSVYHKNFLFYTIPSFGIRNSNAFVSSRNGISAKISQLFCASAEYELGSDFSIFDASLTFQTNDSLEFQAKYTHKKGKSEFFLLMGIYF